MGKEIHLFLYHIDLGGVEKAAVNFANELSEMGNKVFLHPIYKFNVNKFSIDQRVKVVPFLKFYFKGLDRIMSLLPAKIIYKFMMIKYRNNNIDIEIAFQADIPAKIVAASNRNSNKFVWIHGIGMIYESYYEKYDKIIFVGKDIRNHYIETMPEISKANSTVLYNPIEVNNIRQLAKGEVSKEISFDKHTFISVGRLSKEKRFDLMILAIKEFNNKLNDSEKVQLLIIGSGSEENYLKSIISNYNLEDCIKLLGFQKNPYKFLSRANTYLCTSDYEGFNIAVTEAATLGLPIISTDVYGAKEFLGENNEYGIVVDNTEKDLLKAMEVMIDNNHNKQYSDAIKLRFNEFFEKDRISQIKETLSIK